MSRWLCTNRVCHDLLLARRTGDGAGAGIVLAGLGIGVTPWGITEFAEHLGAGQRSHAGLGHDDLSVRVPARMGLRLPLQDLDLLVGRTKDCHDGAGGSRVRAGDRLAAAELPAAQSVLNTRGFGVDVAAAGAFERSPDLGASQLGRRGRAGRLGQQLQRVSGVEVFEGL